MIRVMVVEDSPTVLEFLTQILSQESGILVVGVARDGEEATRIISKVKPDLVTMDVNMPKLDGLEATRRIMQTYPVPIIILSGALNVGDVANTFKAMEAGAVGILSRPTLGKHSDSQKQVNDLVQMIKTMSQVKVARRPSKSQEQSLPMVPSKTFRMIAIGASTGGPIAIQTFLKTLSKKPPKIPILIVQHIVPSFIEGMAEWLSESTGFPVHIAKDHEFPKAGHVYLAPDGCHMGINGAGVIQIANLPPENGSKPAISYFFRSIATSHAPDVVAVLLTGMGKDGAEELKLLRDRGATTIAQDRESSVIFGMPGEAVRLNAAMHILPPTQIADLLHRMLQRESEYE